MSSCGVCVLPCVVDDNDPIVKCNGRCEKSFHTRCIKDDVEGKKLRSGRDWKCKDCRGHSSTHSSVNSTTESALTKDFLVKVMEEFKIDVFGELKTFRNEMSELATSVKFISDKLDESTKLMKKVEDELTAVKRENKELRLKSDDLADEVMSLRDRVRSLEQYSRKNNIEISGLPVTAQENVIDLVKDVGEAVGLKIQEGDISAAHRVPSFKKGRIPSLVVQFVSRATKDGMLSRYREKKGLSAHQINNVFPRQNVYVNEHLSPENKVFLSKLKAKCREVNYAYAWCRDGKFFVRKAQGDRYIRVDNYDELDKLK